MPRSHRYDVLPEDEPLQPLVALDGITAEAQAELMGELRGLTNDVARGFLTRDERIYALVLSNSLSRKDIARATGLAESRVNQIARERAEAQQARWNEHGRGIVERHSVPRPG